MPTTYRKGNFLPLVRRRFLIYQSFDNLFCFSFRSENFHDLLCMQMTGPSSVLIGGCQQNLVEIELHKPTELRSVQINEPDCAILRLNERYVISGDTSGKVFVVFPNRVWLCKFDTSIYIAKYLNSCIYFNI